MTTLTDLFCGMGGSSSGAIQVPGVRVVVAANHWRLAVDTHNMNHPDALHDCADISQTNPGRYPRTDMLWVSPECTNHSQASGRSRTARTAPDSDGDTLPVDAAERSRATMWDVVRFTEHHLYDAVIVENVVEAYHWRPFKSWLSAMHALGYSHQVLYLNSAHAQGAGDPAPQSRDRMYCVFTRDGVPVPDLAKWTSPSGHCEPCGKTAKLVQSFKRTDREPWGRYKAQYVFRCPSCDAVTEPMYLPAYTAIDWSLPGHLIGDRPKPLADKTMARIELGLQRFINDPLAIPLEGRVGKKATTLHSTMRTLTARNETGVCFPFIAELRGGGSKARSVLDPLATVTASGNHHGLVMPGIGWDAQFAYNRTALLKPLSEPTATITTRDRQAILATGPTADECYFRMLAPHEAARAMAFPDEYIRLGNKREQVRMAGNAVTPPAARDIISAVAEALSGALSVAA